jgi:hypothetical protein
MPNELYQHVTKREEELLGTRWCSHCRHRRQAAGGVWKLLNQGKNRRWQCATCVENQKGRAVPTAKT